MEEFKEVLKGLKLSEELGKELESTKEVSPDLIKRAIEDHSNSLRETHKELFLNDPEFVKPIFGKAKGEVLGTVDNQLTSVFGEIKWEDDQGRRPYRQIFEEIKEKLSAKPEKGNEYQQKYADANKELQALRQQIEAGEHPAIKAATAKLQEVIATQERNAAKQAITNMLPPADRMLIGQNEAALLVANYLDSRSLKWGIGENGFEIKTQDGNYPMNETKSEIIKDAKVIIHGYLQERNLLKQNNLPDNPGGGKPPVTDNPAIKKKVSGYRAKIEADLQKERQRFQNRQT